MNPLKLDQNAKLDWPVALLALGMTASVFTERRLITGVGLPELSFLFLGWLAYSGKLPKSNIAETENYLIPYFKGVAIIIPLGIAWNLMTVQSTFSMVHDLLAFCLAFFISKWVLENIITEDNANELIYLYILFGLIVDLWYVKMYRGGSGLFVDTDRFCGYSSDPNQIAEAIFLIPWFGFYFIDYVKKHNLPSVYLWGTVAAIAISIYIGEITDSDSYKAANMAAFCAWAVSHKILSGKSWPLLLIIVAFVAFCLVKGYGFSNLFGDAEHYFQETAVKDNQLNTRFNVWKYGIVAFFHSPLFGNGPGAHSGNWGPFLRVESHNTYIYILMDHGLIGFALLMSIFITLGKKIVQAHSSYLAAIYVGLLVFCFFHSFQRMPLFWFYLYLGNCMANRLIREQQAYLISMEAIT